MCTKTEKRTPRPGPVLDRLGMSTRLSMANPWFMPSSGVKSSHTPRIKSEERTESRWRDPKVSPVAESLSSLCETTLAEAPQLQSSSRGSAFSSRLWEIYRAPTFFSMFYFFVFVFVSLITSYLRFYHSAKVFFLFCANVTVVGLDYVYPIL